MRGCLAVACGHTGRPVALAGASHHQQIALARRQHDVVGIGARRARVRPPCHRARCREVRTVAVGPNTTMATSVSSSQRIARSPCRPWKSSPVRYSRAATPASCHPIGRAEMQIGLAQQRLATRRGAPHRVAARARTPSYRSTSVCCHAVLACSSSNASAGSRTKPTDDIDRRRLVELLAVRRARVSIDGERIRHVSHRSRADPAIDRTAAARHRSDPTARAPAHRSRRLEPLAEASSRIGEHDLLTRRSVGGAWRDDAAPPLEPIDDAHDVRGVARELLGQIARCEHGCPTSITPPAAGSARARWRTARRTRGPISTATNSWRRRRVELLRPVSELSWVT